MKFQQGVIIGLLGGFILSLIYMGYPREVVCQDGAYRWEESIGVSHIECGETVVTILD